MTENGVAFDEPPSADARPIHWQTHLQAVPGAIDQAAAVRGCGAKARRANLGQAHRFAQRFGPIRVDFKLLKGRPKASFKADCRVLIAALGAAALASPGAR